MKKIKEKPRYVVHVFIYSPGLDQQITAQNRD